ncbi:DUF349 domain-containing protein, partial [Ectothiorhodospiraceae bacterium WFHF3C12]|nr:DUF349 domain-containing protein [Ectothiorhodospiraceae bacterium WFHF3C12]
MLQHFRKPKWRHAKASVRRQAVEQLSAQEGESEALLRELACSDEDAGVRRAAIRKLSDLELLRKRMMEEQDAGVAEAAAVRYRQILTGGSGDADLQLRIEELGHCSDVRVIAHALRGGREEALRLAALERCTDESVLADAAVNDPVARVRQAAVERLHSQPALRRVMERTRQGDRKIFRLARDMLQALEAAETASQARAEERSRVLQALQALADRGASPSAAELSRLENRWQAVAGDAEAEASGRFGDLLAAAWQRHRESLQPRQSPQEPPLLAQWRAAADSGRPDPDQLEAVLQALAEAPSDDVPDELRAEAELARRFVTHRDSLRALIRSAAAKETDAGSRDSMEALMDELQWPSGTPRPRTLLDAMAALEQARQPEAEPSGRDQRYAALQERLQGVEEALKEGNLRGAQRALRQARDIVDEAPGGASAQAERALKRYTARVAELRDWRRFATLPKQEQLCEQMEALVGAEMPPPELAEAIKSLQDAWKETGGSDSPESRRLWERFQSASDEAFEPCRAWFDEQARQREANLAERERIVEQLESFLERVDVSGLPTAKLIEIRGTAREEWNHFSPVERRAGKALSRRFEGLMDRLTERIRTEQAANRQRKEALLERAEALPEIEPLAARMDAAKALQAQWREIGPAPKAQERKLFRAFKAACDAVFAERDEARRTEQARQAENKAEAEALCQRLESLAEAESVDAGEMRGTLDETGAAFQALGPVPRGVREGIERRFEKAAGQVRRRLEAARAQRQEQAYEVLRRRAALCAELEAQVMAGSSDPAAIEARWPEAATGEVA